MYLKVFSVYDSKARAFISPFFMANVEVAQRAISDAVADPQHQFGRHASDYVLFEVAGFDDSTGVIEPFTKHVNHGPLSQFVKE